MKRENERYFLNKIMVLLQRHVMFLLSWNITKGTHLSLIINKVTSVLFMIFFQERNIFSMNIEMKLSTPVAFAYN